MVRTIGVATQEDGILGREGVQGKSQKKRGEEQDRDELTRSIRRSVDASAVCHRHGGSCLSICRSWDEGA